MNLTKWKKTLGAALAVLVFAGLAAGCGSDKKQAADKKELTFSKSQGPYSDLFEKGVKPILEKKGYKITGKDMSDLLQAVSPSMKGKWTLMSSSIRLIWKTSIRSRGVILLP